MCIRDRVYVWVLNVVVPVTLMFPVTLVLSDSTIFPLPLSITIFPVVDPPRVSVWLLVVPRLPRPVRKVLLSPEFAEIEAVGVPPLVLVKANFEERVDVPPTRRSYV